MFIDLNEDVKKLFGKCRKPCKLGRSLVSPPRITTLYHCSSNFSVGVHLGIV